MEGNEWLLEDEQENGSDVLSWQESDPPITDDEHTSNWPRSQLKQPEAATTPQIRADTGIVSQVKGLVTNLIDSSAKLLRKGDPNDGDNRADAIQPTYADELENCYDFQRTGAQVVFGAFRFHTSQQFGKLRGVQTLRLPNRIFSHFSVHTSETRHSKNGARPDGACQYGLFRSDNEKIWVLARGYGSLGGVLPDWFCLNFMKRATTRLTDGPLDAVQARNIIKHTFHELADDMLSLLEQIGSNEDDRARYGKTGVVATGGIWLEESKVCVIGLCGNQQSYHLEIRPFTEGLKGQTQVPYCITRPLFRAVHDYTSNSKEKSRVRQRLLNIRDKNKGLGTAVTTPVISPVNKGKKRLMAALRSEPAGPPGASPPIIQSNGAAVGADAAGDARKWCRDMLKASCISSAGVTRGFGFLESRSCGLCSVPDFVIVQTKPATATMKSMTTELILVASNDVFWQVRTPQEVGSHILRIMHTEGKCLQDALDHVCMCVRVESVARGYRGFNAAELIVICVPLID